MVVLFFLSIFNKFKVWLLGGLALLAVLGVMYAKIKKAGRDQAITRGRKKLAKDIKDKRKLEADVSGSDLGDLDTRLHRWTRDD